MSPSIDEGFGHWLAGFIDGEGCFLISPANNGCFVCSFQLKLRDDDAMILHEIQSRTGLGALSAALPSPTTSENGNPQLIWRLRSKADCVGLAEILDRFPLRAKKRNDYLIWRLALQDWRRVPRRKKGHDWSVMAALRHQLVEGRRYGATELPIQPTRESQQLRLVSQLGSMS